MVNFERRGLFLILLAFGIFLPAFAQELSAQNWAEKMFQKKNHDFRMVGRGTKSVYHFDFSNLYEEDVHVAAVIAAFHVEHPDAEKQQECSLTARPG